VLVVAVLWCGGYGTLLPTNNGNPLPELDCPLMRTDKEVRGIIEILKFCIIADDVPPPKSISDDDDEVADVSLPLIPHLAQVISIDW